MKFNLIFLLFLLCSCVQSNEQSVINEVEKTTGVVDIIQQEHVDNKLKRVQRMNHERGHCMELFPNEYQTMLERTQSYYESQMRSHEHEFSRCKAANRCIFLPSGENITAPELKSKCKGMCELQVPTAEQILESVKESMHDFAQYRKCSTDGWESEVLKYICPCDVCYDTPICAPNTSVPAQK